MTFKSRPKQKNLYPKTLSTFERKRNRDWVIGKIRLEQRQRIRGKG